MITEKTFKTRCGVIHYWIDGKADCAGPSLVFLPGLTADHRLFDKQVEHFAGTRPVFVWDAPGHASSRPFELSFNLTDKAQWLDDILCAEGLANPVIIGQSMGGYVGQEYARLHPEKIAGFISIDSAPLQREYLTGVEIWMLKHTEFIYRHYPWKWLLKSGTEGVATSTYGRRLMREMMMVYDGHQAEYAALAGHGFRIIAEAAESGHQYEIDCPALLICGSKDKAGSAMRYNKAWHKKSGIPLEWIAGAGHNANTDAPEQTNRLIDQFIEKL